VWIDIHPRGAYVKAMFPSLFLSHGAPTLPFDDCPARDFLKSLGREVGRPDAILVASAHWDTSTPLVNAPPVNATIHDFRGFPEALYELTYPAPGDVHLAERTASLLGTAGLSAEIDRSRGLDHGAWVPLMLMYPDADIPVTQLSIQSGQGAHHHIALDPALVPLRDEGVLVIGSGSFTHNLRALDRSGDASAEPAWSIEFSDWIHEKLIARDDTALAQYRAHAPHAAIAQPSDDHFVPLHVAYGAGGREVRRLHKSATFGSLRMDAYAFG